MCLFTHKIALSVWVKTRLLNGLDYYEFGAKICVKESGKSMVIREDALLCIST